MKTTIYILLKVETEKPVNDLSEKVAGRAYTIQNVNDVTASIVTEDDVSKMEKFQ